MYDSVRTRGHEFMFRIPGCQNYVARNSVSHGVAANMPGYKHAGSD